MESPHTIRGGEIVLPARELQATVAWFTRELGFRIEAVFPADDPEVTVVAGHGLRIRLDRNAGGEPGVLRLLVDGPIEGETRLVAPNGTRIELAPVASGIVRAPLVESFVLSRAAQATWTSGRAGMAYRDLVPGRQGGYLVAALIRVSRGGPVDDWVHFHRVRFQMIHCWRGCARLVYEDQGPPFLFEAGDAVLQPPGIRHRVLECSDGLEVVEVTCPARHETLADHDLALPAARVDAEREFDGQRFLRHRASRAEWLSIQPAGFEARDLGIARATRGLASARVVRTAASARTEPPARKAELAFRFLLSGHATVLVQGHPPQSLGPGDAVVIPSQLAHGLEDCSRDLEYLEVDLVVDERRPPTAG